MRKLITSNLVSLDGYLAGPGGDLSWHKVNDEFLNYAVDMLNSVDLFLFGRRTYDTMASYWSTDHAKTNDPVVAGKMNGLDKIVFSRTMKTAEWENTTVFDGINEKNIRELKARPGKDIVILGSGTIVSALTELDLIDEHRLIISPVILGGGTLQFTGNLTRKNFELTSMQKFKTGVVMLTYQPK
jgi:dihydrofolate reductase